MNNENAQKFKFFISYRRDDHPDFVEHIRSWFAFRFGSDNIFMDFEKPFSDEDNTNRILNQVEQCDVLLAIIGPSWEPFADAGRVQVEISTALEMNKLVVPICIKGGKLPEMGWLPKELRGMLNIQEIYLDSGQRFINHIEDTILSIQQKLINRYNLQETIRRYEEISPAPGLALGYYINFIRRVGLQLLSFGDTVEGQSIEIRIDDQLIEPTTNITFDLIIPNRIDQIKPDTLSLVKTNLLQAEIQGPTGRPLIVDARKTDKGYQFIDFPTTVAVLDYWLNRRLDKELNPDSEDARRLEREEIDRFHNSLNFWIDDQSNPPQFKEIIRVIAYQGNKEETIWLRKFWEPNTNLSRSQLLEKMNQRLNLSEVKTITFKLSIDWDNLAGETKYEKIQELILVFERRGKFDSIVDYLYAHHYDLFSS